MAAMSMPKVEKCRVTDCSYNQGEMCHALAITIGDAENPACDTYFDFGTKGGDESAIAGVGACKVSACEYNENLECSAQSIMVAAAQDQADCLTFKRK